METSFYFQTLYPMQNRVLRIITDTNTGFYLTGGTALSRAYLRHRFSDDLDLFVNDEDKFSLWVSEITQAFVSRDAFTVAVLRRDERFVRMTVTESGVSLRIELVNDVPAHTGEVVIHDVLGRLDSAENILANKVTAAIDRNEPKDLADIWGLCCRMSLPLKKAIEHAGSKAAGVFPADLARVLCSVTEAHWSTIRWIDPPTPDKFKQELRALGESLIL